MTPLDWTTLAWVIVATSPFSSFSTMSLPRIIAHSVPPLTVFSVAVPLPFLIHFFRSTLDRRPATT